MIIFPGNTPTTRRETCKQHSSKLLVMNSSQLQQPTMWNDWIHWPSTWISFTFSGVQAMLARTLTFSEASEEASSQQQWQLLPAVLSSRLQLALPLEASLGLLTSLIKRSAVLVLFNQQNDCGCQHLLFSANFVLDRQKCFYTIKGSCWPHPARPYLALEPQRQLRLTGPRLRQVTCSPKLFP